MYRQVTCVPVLGSPELYLTLRNGGYERKREPDGGRRGERGRSVEKPRLSGESKVREVSAKCTSAIPHMPRGIKSNIETLVTGTWAGSRGWGDVGV